MLCRKNCLKKIDLGKRSLLKTTLQVELEQGLNTEIKPARTTMKHINRDFYLTLSPGSCKSVQLFWMKYLLRQCTVRMKHN